MKVLGLRRQFGASVIAQGFSQAVTIGTQLLVLPVMLTIWGSERYGLWLTITAVPSYLALVDLGLSQVAANDMTMRVARGDTKGAVVVSHTAWLMYVATSFLLTICALGVAFLLPFDAAADGAAGFSGSEISVTILLLAGSVAFALAFGVVGAAMRAVGLFWLTVSVNATSRLLEAVFFVIAAILGAGFAGAAATMLVTRAVLFAAFAAGFYRMHPLFMPSLRRADVALLLKMIPNSLGYMSLTLGNAFSIQGVTILVGFALGPTAVVVVNAIRTLTRLGRTAVSVIVHSVEPIYAQLAGQGAKDRAQKTQKSLVLSVGLGTLIYAAGMGLLGQPFLAWWTQGVVVDQAGLFWLMLVAVVLEIGWFALQAPFVATNRHGIFSVWFVVSAILSLVVLWPAFSIFGIVAAGISTVILHGLMLTITITLVLILGV